MNLFGYTNKTFGLDIGFETLKLCQVSRVSNKGIEIWGNIEFPITEPILDRDRIKDKAAAANIIKEACRKAKPHPINATSIVSALPETFVFSKTIQVPKMALSELSHAVPNEAAQYLPIPITEVYLDFQIMMTRPDEPLIDVLVAAAPKQLVDDYVEMSKMANLELVGLETKPIATGRAVIKDQTKSIAVVHIGTELTRIAIWDKANIRLVTTAATGKNQILQNISGTNPKIHTLQDLDFQQDESIFALAFDTIIDEVLDAIRYHQNRSYKPTPITEIQICGSVASIKGIDEYFGKMAKIKSTISQPKIINLKSLEPQFIPALGLALR